MDPIVAMVVVVVLIALLFDFTNGFHDASNAIATSIATGALTPRGAVLLASSLNFVGALLGVEVAKTIQDIIALDGNGYSEAHRLLLVLSALLGAIVWNIITWWFGIPSSSSHAMIGGLVGVGVASTTVVHWSEIIDKVLIPMVLSPVIGFVGAFAVMAVIMWAFRRVRPSSVNRGFRLAQTFSAAAVALGHGLQDAQKTMGVIVLALVAGGFHRDTDVPLWVVAASAAAIAAGTLSGGWRVMRTLGRRIIRLDPPTAFAAESVAAAALYVMSIALHAPVSTTHTVTAAIVGSGSAKRGVAAVRWNVARSVAVAWVVTMPAAALLAASFYGVARFMLY